MTEKHDDDPPREDDEPSAGIAPVARAPVSRVASDRVRAAVQEALRSVGPDVRVRAQAHEMRSTRISGEFSEDTAHVLAVLAHELTPEQRDEVLAQHKIKQAQAHELQIKHLDQLAAYRQRQIDAKAEQSRHRKLLAGFGIVAFVVFVAMLLGFDQAGMVPTIVMSLTSLVGGLGLKSLWDHRERVEDPAPPPAPPPPAGPMLPPSPSRPPPDEP